MQIVTSISKVWRDTFPDVCRRQTGLTALSLATLTLYIYLGRGERAPSWFVNGWEQWTAFGSLLMYRYWWKHTVAFVLLALVPIAVMRLFAGWQLRDLGIPLPGSSREFILVLGLWVVFIPVVWLISDLPSFQHTYPQVPAVADSATLFWAHHGHHLLYWFAWKFFFRGLLLFGFERYIGSTAVLLSTFPNEMGNIGCDEHKHWKTVFQGIPPKVKSFTPTAYEVVPEEKVHCNEDAEGVQ